MELAPICKIHYLHDDLVAALESKKFKTAKNIAISISNILPLAVDPKTSKTTFPHLDGVYKIGIQRIFRIPKSTKDAIEKMNKDIEQAKLKISKLPKQKKKKKK